MVLHQHVAKYISMMRSKFSWYGTEDPNNKTLSRRLNILYTKLKWIWNIAVPIIVGATLYRVESFGLYDGTFIYLPYSFIMSILVIIATYTGRQQEQLTKSFSYFFIKHNEPWMNAIRDRYVGFLTKFIKFFFAYIDIVVISYLTVPFIMSNILHFGFGYLPSPFCLPGPFTPFLDKVVKWDYKYYLVTALNAWTIQDEIFTLQSFVVSYSMLSTFFLSELEIFTLQLKSLNDINYAIQKEVDEQYRFIIAAHNDVVRLNYDLKLYFGLLGAFVSVYTSVMLTLCSFTVFAASNAVLQLSYGSGLIMFFLWGLLYCYLGQLIENKSDDIFRSTYGLRWYELSPNVRKSINMMLRQARAPLTIDYHGTFKMNFNNFKQILRNSYSYFTLLQSVTTN